MHETKRRDPERAILIGLKLRNGTHHSVEQSLEELTKLANTAGLHVADKIAHTRPKIDPAYFIGRGKAQLISEFVASNHIDVAIFDDDLSPGQAKNLESLLNTKVIDRSALILDIFARRARSREACTQVELAQLEYLLPRLTRQWTHLSRQIGGIGLRGPGETQLEVDRRLVRKRISHLSKQLKKIEVQRSLREKHREDVCRIALVGYTNAGKSTLLNALTESDVFVEDRLFATLDPAVRALDLNTKTGTSRIRKAVLIDTVGFIRKLPHHLVASFRSTLKEAQDAELLLNVIDVTHPNFEQQIETVQGVMKDLSLSEKPVLHVFNKIDRMTEMGMIHRLEQKYRPAVFVSAHRHMFLDELREQIVDLLTSDLREFNIELSIDCTASISQIYQLANVLNRRYEDNKVILRVCASRAAADKIHQLINTHPANGSARL